MDVEGVSFPELMNELVLQPLAMYTLGRAICSLPLNDDFISYAIEYWK